MPNSANAGVRNLRAMFENQNAAASPEPRGRSPAGSVTSDGTNRPTSRVRASFVSVESNNRTPIDLGATKGVSANTPQAQHRESFSVSEDSGAEGLPELKRVVSGQKDEREKSAAIPEAIPEQAVETRESSRGPPPIRKAPEDMANLGTIMKGSDFPEPTAAETAQPRTKEPATQGGAEQSAPESVEEKPATLSTDAPADNPDKTISGVQEEASLKPADLTDKAAVSGGAALPPPTEDLSATAQSHSPARSKSATGSGHNASGTPTTPGKAAVKKPSTISTAKEPTQKTLSAKSPLPKSPLPKTPTTSKPAPIASASKPPAPTKAQPKAAAPREAIKAPTSKPSRTSLKSATATTATTASAGARAKAPVAETKKAAASKPTVSAPATKDGTSTSPGGFKKPRPKSPTRPVRLPSHLTAPTASSAAKHGEDSASQKLVRKPSTATRPPPKAAPPAKKQPSRASLAPSTTTKRPESRASTQGGSSEGFLARMMRPTASSASKTNDKPASPPRKGATIKAPAKAKGQEGVVSKSKKKVAEVASKAKEAVTNNHSDKNDANGETTNGTTHDETADEAPHDGPDNSEAIAHSGAESVSADPSSSGGAVQEHTQETSPLEHEEQSAIEV